MDKEKELKNTAKLVKDILEYYPIARDSDDYLYIRVAKELNPTVLNRPFAEVMANLKELGLPCFETVRRCRQKIQADNEDLKGSEKTRSHRAINEEIFKEFARG